MWIDCWVLRHLSLQFGLARSETATNLVGDSQQMPSTVQ